MVKPYIVGINGSPHNDGNCVKMIELVLKGAKQEDAETNIINLYDLNIGHSKGLYSKDPKLEISSNINNNNNNLKNLHKEILKADGLVLATPTYWANMSGIMKDFIDNLTPLENDGFKLEGKLAGCIAVSKENEGGIEMAAMSMVSALIQMGFLFPPNSVMWSPGNWNTAKGKHYDWAKEEAFILGRNMVKLINILRDKSINWS